MKVMLSDIVIFDREVDIPERCPECDADLQTGYALTVWEYQDQKRSASLAIGALEMGDDLPQGGEAWIMVGYDCSSCSFTLASNSELRMDGNKPLVEQMDSLTTFTKEWSIRK